MSTERELTPGIARRPRWVFEGRPTTRARVLISAVAVGAAALFLVPAALAVVPVVSGFSPASGVVGASVTVTGSGFTGASAVAFNGTSATFSFVNDSQISTSVPNGATTGKISVTTPGGTGLSGTAFKVKPKISGFTPTSGPVGTSVTISGSAFTGATAVTFNGV